MQVQITVPPGSATFKEFGAYVHVGEINCPFCSKIHVVLGPKNGLGLAFLKDKCRHVVSTAAGESCYDITIIFESLAKEHI